MNGINNIQAEGQLYDILAPEVVNDYVEKLGKPCANPNGYTTGSLILATDGGNVQRLYKVTQPITSSQNIVEDGNVVRKKLGDLFDDLEVALDGEIDDVDTELGNVKQALSNVEGSTTDLKITGTTNNTGATIAKGRYFYLNGTFVKAKTSIANGATFTLDTNYEVATLGNDLANQLNGNGLASHILGSSPYLEYYVSSATGDFTVTPAQLSAGSYLVLKAQGFGRKSGIYFLTRTAYTSQLTKIAEQETDTDLTLVSDASTGGTLGNIVFNIAGNAGFGISFIKLGWR